MHIWQKNTNYDKKGYDDNDDNDGNIGDDGDDGVETWGGNHTALIWGQAAIAIGPPIMFNQAPSICICISICIGKTLQELWMLSGLLLIVR